jgi:hypothetical protein
MPNAAQPSLLRRLIGLPAPVPEVDPADMGTAMGLDYCLDEVPEVVAATTLAKAGRASPTQADWLRRLMAS